MLDLIKRFWDREKFLILLIPFLGILFYYTEIGYLIFGIIFVTLYIATHETMHFFVKQGVAAKVWSADHHHKYRAFSSRLILLLVGVVFSFTFFTVTSKASPARNRAQEKETVVVKEKESIEKKESAEIAKGQNESRVVKEAVEVEKIAAAKNKIAPIKEAVVKNVVLFKEKPVYIRDDAEAKKLRDELKKIEQELAKKRGELENSLNKSKKDKLQLESKVQQLKDSIASLTNKFRQAEIAAAQEQEYMNNLALSNSRIAESVNMLGYLAKPAPQKVFTQEDVAKVQIALLSIEYEYDQFAMSAVPERFKATHQAYLNNLLMVKNSIIALKTIVRQVQQSVSKRPQTVG